MPPASAETFFYIYWKVIPQVGEAVKHMTMLFRYAEKLE
jgi:hypothetical protein